MIKVICSGRGATMTTVFHGGHQSKVVVEALPASFWNIQKASFVLCFA
jgi:hypothetical protein